MARFVVIDQSVTSPGGHNFEHANDVLHAAEQLGYEPVLAANEAIADRRDLPGSWRILPVFPDAWNPLHWLGPDGRSYVPSNVDGALLSLDGDEFRARGMLDSLMLRFRRWRDQRRTEDRRLRIERFAQACARFWKTVEPCAEDRILLPSVTEFDLLGLVSFLKDEPRSAEVDWHLLFHFNLFTGRTPTYERQRRTLKRFQLLFRTALAPIPKHRLHFYGVTDLIAEQYNHLDTVRFTEMPYTINGSIQVNRQPASDGRLRLTCPGVIRREKGKHQIRNLVRHVWADHLKTGKVQLFFQGQPKDLRRFFPKETFNRSAFSETPDAPVPAPIVIVRHPLSAQHYAQLIRESHIGLFLHDSERYFSRCSGTLVELLGAGVPVIVPAGCWLAEQVAEANYRHLDKLARSTSVIGRAGVDDMQWSVESSGERAGQSVSRVGHGLVATARVSLPVDTVNLLVSWELPVTTQPGHYLRVAASLLDGDGRQLQDPQVSILGQRAAGGRQSTLFQLMPGARSVNLTFSNAYENVQLAVTHPQVAFLGDSGAGWSGAPAGAVGLIAADLAQYSRLLSDLAAHYEHYRHTAIEFAAGWSRAHSAAAVIGQIDVATRAAQQRAAA